MALAIDSVGKVWEKERVRKGRGVVRWWGGWVISDRQESTRWRRVPSGESISNFQFPNPTFPNLRSVTDIQTPSILEETLNYSLKQ